MIPGFFEVLGGSLWMWFVFLNYYGIGREIVALWKLSLSSSTLLSLDLTDYEQKYREKVVSIESVTVNGSPAKKIHLATQLNC